MAGVAHRASRLDAVAAAALCAIGAALRIVAYAQHRSLWYDEAALALNVVNRGFLGLLAPLDNLQTAPPLFLWAERLVVVAFGPNEWALRAVPLVAGIALAPLMWRVARRLLPAPIALLGVALVALSPALVRYSAEAKPYVVDAFVTLVLLDRALAATEPGASRGTWWSLAISGVVALTASTPALFVLAGVIAYVVVKTVVSDGAIPARRPIALALGWTASFLLLLATVFRPLVDPDAPIGRYMQWYWATNFLTSEPPGLRTKAAALTWAALTNTFFGAGAVRGMTALMVGAVLVGLIALLTSRRIAAVALLTVPGLAVIVASSLRRYPIAERLVLFAAPLSALLVASALLVVPRIIGQRVATWAAAAATAVVLVLSTVGVVASYRSSDGRQESRELVRAAVASRASGMPMWVSAGGEVAWRFYSDDRAPVQWSNQTPEGLPGGGTLRHNVLVGAWYKGIPERIVPVVDDTTADVLPSPWSENESARLRKAAQPCALVFLSHIMPGEGRALLASVLRRGGRVASTNRAPGAELHRVCFDGRT